MRYRYHLHQIFNYLGPHALRRDVTLGSHYIWFHEILPALVIVAAFTVPVAFLCCYGLFADWLVSRVRDRALAWEGWEGDEEPAGPAMHLAMWLEDVAWHLRDPERLPARVPEREFRGYFEKAA